MPHSYTSCLIHAVFSTKERRQQIVPEIRPRLYEFMGGIARDNGMVAIRVGGTEDHMHAFLSLPSGMTISKALQLIKGGSSKFVHGTFPKARDFAWQEGYGAFSIGASQRERTIAYIEGQEEHHKKVSFQDEFRAILRKHGIEWDERYVWG